MKIDKLEFERRRPHLPERAVYEQCLDFKVSLLRTDLNLDEVVRLRKSAFDRHYSRVAGHKSNEFGLPERKDTQAGSVLLLARAKADESLLGSLRIESNIERPLSAEHEIDLPASIKGRPIAVVTRFSVVNGHRGIGVFSALSKALYLYCVAKQICAVVLFTAIPALERFYADRGFSPLAAGGREYVLKEYPGMSFSAYVCVLDELRSVLSVKSDKKLYDFFFEKFHPDIEIFNSVASFYEIRRTSDMPASFG
jgi:hypothetical protein